jgi:ribosomal-protein-serine acetyltransferase
MYQDLNQFHLQVTKDLCLVAPQLLHAKAVYDLIEGQRPYFENWLSWVERAKTLHDIRRFIREAQAFNEGGQRLTTFVHFKNQIVGSLSFTCLNMRHKKGELGYWLSQTLQGKGLITESCVRFIDYAFQELDLHRIEIRVLSDNEKSKGIPLRLGFQKEGVLRQAIWLNKRYHDMEIFGLLNSQWNNMKKVGGGGFIVHSS